MSGPPRHEIPDSRVDTGHVDPDEHLVLAGNGTVDVPQAQGFRGVRVEAGSKGARSLSAADEFGPSALTCESTHTSSTDLDTTATTTGRSQVGDAPADGEAALGPVTADGQALYLSVRRLGATTGGSEREIAARRPTLEEAVDSLVGVARAVGTRLQQTGRLSSPVSSRSCPARSWRYSAKPRPGPPSRPRWSGLHRRRDRPERCHPGPAQNHGLDHAAFHETASRRLGAPGRTRTCGQALRRAMASALVVEC